MHRKAGQRKCNTNCGKKYGVQVNLRRDCVTPSIVHGFILTPRISGATLMRQTPTACVRLFSAPCLPAYIHPFLSTVCSKTQADISSVASEEHSTFQPA